MFSNLFQTESNLIANTHNKSLRINHDLYRLGSPIALGHYVIPASLLALQISLRFQAYSIPTTIRLPRHCFWQIPFNIQIPLHSIGLLSHFQDCLIRASDDALSKTQALLSTFMSMIGLSFPFIMLLVTLFLTFAKFRFLIHH